ncbi:uncharacterized protein LOC144581560 [Callithrix jacchus]
MQESSKIGQMQCCSCTRRWIRGAHVKRNPPRKTHLEKWWSHLLSPSKEHQSRSFLGMEAWKYPVTRGNAAHSGNEKKGKGAQRAEASRNNLGGQHRGRLRILRTTITYSKHARAILTKN